MNEDVRNEQPFQEYPGTQQDSINRPPLPIDVIHAFTRLTPQQVDQFYKGYQYWQLQQQVINRKLRITTLEQQIAENAAQMRQNEPSALALSILAQFQANDVNDIDLLDRMLERGDTWLDHTQQLLERCEQLDMIQGSYTEWCENALEGAYDWIETMDRAESPSAEPQPDSTTPEAISDSDSVVPPTITEEELLRMLMIDTDDTEKIPALRRQKITSPLPPEEPPETSTISPKRTQPLAPIETTEPEASQPEEAAAATATPAAPEQPTDEPETPPEQPEPFTPGDAELPHPLDVATPETVESEANLYALESTGEETGLESAPEAESQEQAATLQTDMPAEPNIPETITEPSEPTTTDQPEIMAEQPELPTTDQSDTTTEQPESSEIEQPELSEAEPPSTDQSAASQEQEFDVPAQEEALTESMPEAALSEPEQPETLPEEEPPAPKISALEQEPAHTQETIEELAPEQPTDEPTQPISTDEPALEQPATPAQPILPDSTLTEAAPAQSDSELAQENVSEEVGNEPTQKIPTGDITSNEQPAAQETIPAEPALEQPASIIQTEPSEEPAPEEQPTATMPAAVPEAPVDQPIASTTPITETHPTYPAAAVSTTFSAAGVESTQPPPSPATTPPLDHHRLYEERDSEENEHDTLTTTRPITWNDEPLPSPPQEEARPRRRGFFAWLTALWRK